VKTWGDVRTQFHRLISDQAASIFTNANAESYANIALNHMAGESRHIDRLETGSTTADQATYSTVGFTTEVYRIWRVTHDDDPLMSVTTDRLDATDHSWRSHGSGTPLYYLLDQTETAVYLFPIPGTSSLDLEFFVESAPAPMDNDNTTNNVELPVWAIPGLLFWMLSYAFDADTPLRNLDSAAFYRHMAQRVTKALQVRSCNRLPKEWSKAAAGQATVPPQFDRLPGDGISAPA